MSLVGGGEPLPTCSRLAVLQFLTESMRVYGDWTSLRAEYSGRLRRTV